jgi:hypothetical protein
LELASPTATGFFIVLKLAGITHGFGWAPRVAHISMTAAPVKNNLSLFIILDFKLSLNI